MERFLKLLVALGILGLALTQSEVEQLRDENADVQLTTNAEPIESIPQPEHIASFSNDPGCNPVNWTRSRKCKRRAKKSPTKVKTLSNADVFEDSDVFRKLQKKLKKRVRSRSRNMNDPTCFIWSRSRKRCSSGKRK